MSTTTDELHNKRHSLAHALGAALVALYPETKLAIGPAIDDGFYYDAELPVSLSADDLPKVEKKMRAILAQWKSFEKKIVTPEEALDHFSGNPYKCELINQFTAEGKELTFYTSGTFTDLCGGGHIDDISAVHPDSFTLRSVAGAYWRGDEHNTMLTRVYGLAFDTPEELTTHQRMLEEAKERDHRKIGKELGLFTFSPLVGPGLPLFTPKGNALRHAIEQSLSILLDKYGYERVWIPHLAKSDLYKTSGHWEKFGDELFRVRGKNEEYVLKPMNCPHHTQIYASALRSYHDLPVRYAEFTTVYRDEQKGELIGLSRVLSITQDDGHIFCTPEQINSEVSATIALVKEFYTALGFFQDNDCEIFLSVRGDDTSKYLGESTVWDNAEQSLKDGLQSAGLSFVVDPGEAAFYGPKIDFVFRDSLNRKRQLATIQLDFVMPERFGLTYIDKHNTKQTPIMIHRAISGSLERFLGVMIEHFAGNFPFFLTPVQVRVISVNADSNAYAETVLKELRHADLRADADTGQDTIGKKIAKTRAEKIPARIVVGKDEAAAGTVTLEMDGDKQKLPISEATALLASKAAVFNEAV